MEENVNGLIWEGFNKVKKIGWILISLFWKKSQTLHISVAARRAQSQCNRGHYCQHRYEDFSSSPDPYEDYDEDYEHEAMVDEVEDPLEMARQG